MILTDREKKLALVKYIIHGTSPFSDAPLETRINMLKAASNIIGIGFDESEYMEIGQECLFFQEEVNQSLSKFLGYNNDILIHAHTQMGKGNDSMEGKLGKNFIDEALGILGKGKIE